MAACSHCLSLLRSIVGSYPAKELDLRVYQIFSSVLLTLNKVPARLEPLKNYFFVILAFSRNQPAQYHEFWIIPSRNTAPQSPTITPL